MVEVKFVKGMDSMTLGELTKALKSLLPPSRPRVVRVKIKYSKGQLIDAGILYALMQQAFTEKYRDSSQTALAIVIDETLAEDIVIDRLE